MSLDLYAKQWVNSSFGFWNSGMLVFLSFAMIIMVCVKNLNPKGLFYSTKSCSDQMGSSSGMREPSLGVK